MATIKITEGSDYSDYIQWATSECRFVDATLVPGAPLRITATGHGIIDGWGLVYILRSDDFDAEIPRTVKVVDANTLTIPCLDGGAMTAGPVVLRVLEPVDLAGFTARMHVRATVESTATLLDLDTGNPVGEPRIVVDNTTKRISRIIPHQYTTALTWDKGVYDMEMVASDGTVTRIDSGAVVVSKEVTRE